MRRKTPRRPCNGRNFIETLVFVERATRLGGEMARNVRRFADPSAKMVIAGTRYKRLLTIILLIAQEFMAL